MGVFKVGDIVSVYHEETVDKKGMHWVRPDWQKSNPNRKDNVVRVGQNLHVVDFGPAGVNVLCEVRSSTTNPSRQLWVKKVNLFKHK